MKSSDLICILGLSNDPSRYSYKALTLLKKKGFTNLLGIHPTLKDVAGTNVLPSLQQIKATPHTVTVYLNPDKLEKVLVELIKLNPKRIILNPGTERDDLIKTLESALPKTEVIQACTLVMLQTGQF